MSDFGKALDPMMVIHPYNCKGLVVFVPTIVKGKTSQTEHQQRYPHRQLCPTCDQQTRIMPNDDPARVTLAMDTIVGRVLF